MASTSPVLAHTHRLYGADWCWQEFSEQRITEFLAEGQLLTFPSHTSDPQALAAVVHDDEDCVLWVGLVDGPPQTIPELLKATRAWAYDNGARSVLALVPSLAWLRDSFRKAGFCVKDWKGELVLYQRHLDTSPEQSKRGRA
jgi:hypothetical protein